MANGEVEVYWTKVQVLGQRFNFLIFIDPKQRQVDLSTSEL